MKNRKTHKTTLNRNVILFIFVGLVCISFARFSFMENEIGAGIAMSFFAALALVVPLGFMPWGYCFDPEGVSIKYIFLTEERYLWKNVHAVSTVQAIADGGRHSLFLYDLQIDGNVEGKKRRYMDGRICKSGRNKRLIQKYWDGTVEGYWHDEVQAIKNWRSKKKKKPHKLYSTDEIVILERSARASVRTWLEFPSAEAAQYDLAVRTEYLYMTEDDVEHRSRPQASHTYTAVTYISRPGETKEDRIVVFSTELIRVRLGKSAYRGVANVDAEKEFQTAWTEMMNQIKEKGFEVYLKEM